MFISESILQILLNLLILFLGTVTLELSGYNNTLSLEENQTITELQQESSYINLTSTNDVMIICEVLALVRPENSLQGNVTGCKHTSN